MSLDPRPFTLGQLCLMFESRIDSHRSDMRSILAAIYSNVFQKLIKPSEITFESEKSADQEMTVEQTEALFIAMGVCTSV
ncbi:hypothetical protein [Gimesia sp.]|uniref:hypothetical protein n=1 Tax=Gimesia sp. TaxID=2024833 RepID=UPI003A95D55F